MKNNKKNILFVGANDMHEIDSYKNDYQNGLFIEAIPQVFQQLKNNLQSANNRYNTNFLAVNALVSSKPNQEYTFNIFNNNGASSSIYEPNQDVWQWPHVQHTHNIVLKSTTIEIILREYGWENIQFDLVLDVQGAELDVLRGFGEKNLNNVQKLTTEISTKPFYKNAVLFDELNQYITSYGFKLLEEPKDVHCDVTYIR